MKQQSFSSFVGLLAGALLAVQGAAQAQSATIYGSVGNFDVANNQHKEAHGFELELEGVHPEDIASTFDSQRYGRPSIVPTDTGTIVRWSSGYDFASGFTATTAPHPDAAPLAGSCYQWSGAAYDQSGCEHFGASLRVNATRATYRWLVADVQTPGAVVAGPVPIAVAAPAYSVAPPAVAGALPVLNADVDAPAPDVYPTHYGDAYWLKIYKSEVPRAVALDELTNDNPAVVPEDDAAPRSVVGVHPGRSVDQVPERGRRQNQRVARPHAQRRTDWQRRRRRRAPLRAGPVRRRLRSGVSPGGVRAVELLRASRW